MRFGQRRVLQNPQRDRLTYLSQLYKLNLHISGWLLPPGQSSETTHGAYAAAIRSWFNTLSWHGCFRLEGFA